MSVAVQARVAPVWSPPSKRGPDTNAATGLPCQTPGIEDQWHPTEHDLATIRAAKNACGQCPIIDGCLTTALALPPSSAQGIWGGTDERERANLRRRHQRARNH